ncbi:MAG: hypothetical protein GY865_19905 [candidate division Zixibacteria bacterium]|nr:hypothetical protein [candidate division Zixibacteria bacterium]
MKNIFVLLIGLIALGILFMGCENAMEPQTPIDSLEAEISGLTTTANKFGTFAPAPSPLVTVSVGEDNLNFWPYSGNDFSANPVCPINLIFIGEADPRDIRAALFSLDGDRTATGFPDVPPFNDTWQDAIGFVEASYGGDDGWTAGSIQLSCGDFGPARFHLRLYRLGKWTVANAHFEILIPGTTDHQVISWELAEQLVIADFIRSGLLDTDIPMIPTDQINESPFSSIPAIIYNELPTDLRYSIGGPLSDVTENVPIGSDGHAMILNLMGKVERTSGTYQKDFVIEFGQIIPKPFCSSGPMDYVYVQGPVHMVQTIRLNEHGDYSMIFHAQGELSITPVNPLTGEVIGEPLTAHAREAYKSKLTDRYSSASSMLFQKIIPSSDPGAGRLFKFLHLNTNGANVSWLDIKCPSVE